MAEFPFFGTVGDIVLLKHAGQMNPETLIAGYGSIRSIGFRLHGYQFVGSGCSCILLPEYAIVFGKAPLGLHLESSIEGEYRHINQCAPTCRQTYNMDARLATLGCINEDILPSCVPQNHLCQLCSDTSSRATRLFAMVVANPGGSSLPCHRARRSSVQCCQFLSHPSHEQAAIVRYLDHADRRIRRYVDAKRKLIGLLEEEKQAIVNQAVTRGLDPNVPLKPSGVEWLGDIPAHWDMLQLGRAHRHLPTYGYGLGQPPRESVDLPADDDTTASRYKCFSWATAVGGSSYGGHMV